MNRKSFPGRAVAVLLLTLCQSLCFASPRGEAGETYLLAVGVPEYKYGIQPLPSPALDAVRFIKSLPTAKGVVLANGLTPESGIAPPTKRNIMQALTEIALKSRREDTVWFYFSGHGTALDGRSFLVPEDARPNQPDTLLSVTEIRDIFRKCAAKRKILVLDACCSGSAKGGPGLPKAIHWEDVLQPETGIITMAACEVGQSALDLGSGKGGLFTLALLAALEGGAGEGAGSAISLGGLKTYVIRLVESVSREKFGRLQTPVFLYKDAGTTPVATVHAQNSVPAGSLPDLSGQIFNVRQPLKPGLVIWLDEEQADEDKNVTRDSLLQPLLEGQCVEEGFPVLIQEDARNFRVALTDQNPKVAAKALLKANSRFLLRGSVKIRPLPVRFTEQLNYNSVEAVVTMQLLDSAGAVLCSVRTTETGRGNSEQRARDMAMSRAAQAIYAKLQPVLARELERKP